MKIKMILAAIALLIIPTTMSAQRLQVGEQSSGMNKLFTLEDLNFGETNYANLRPQNMWLTWWGEKLIETDVEECYTIDTKTGKKNRLSDERHLPLP